MKKFWVTPARAGIQGNIMMEIWIPAFVGMTNEKIA
jgi:hypothetical protein